MNKKLLASVCNVLGLMFLSVPIYFLGVHTASYWHHDGVGNAVPIEDASRIFEEAAETIDAAKK